MKYPEAIRSIAVSFLLCSVCTACASRSVQIVHKAKPELEQSDRNASESTRYTSRVMSLADTRGVSVLWFNAPIETTEAAPAAAPVACATPTKN
jgi:hypothetical protein